MTTNVASGKWSTYALFIALVFVSGCSNQYAEETKRLKQAVTNKLTALGSRINAGALPNTVLIATYADKLAQAKPDLKPVAEVLRLDATTKGPLYRGLAARLAAVSDAPNNKREFLPIIQELDSFERRNRSNYLQRQFARRREHARRPLRRRACQDQYSSKRRNRECG